MIAYKVLYSIFKLCMCFFLYLRILEAQEINENQQANPQNLVPEIETEILNSPEKPAVKNNFTNDSQLEKDITITELPKISSTWIPPSLKSSSYRY